MGWVDRVDLCDASAGDSYHLVDLSRVEGVVGGGLAGGEDDGEPDAIGQGEKSVVFCCYCIRIVLCRIDVLQHG